jgi:hypothetical protein
METWKTMHCRLCINFYGTSYSECVCGGGGGDTLHPSLPLASSVRINAKTTVHCSPGSSMLLSIMSALHGWPIFFQKQAAGF